MAVDISWPTIGWIEPPNFTVGPGVDRVEIAEVPAPPVIGHPPNMGWMCCACCNVWSPVLIGCPQCNQEQSHD